MAFRISRRSQTAHPATTGRRVRSEATTRRLSGLGPQNTTVPKPRETTEESSTSHPIMHWVLVTDDSGRARPEARWF